MEKRIARNTAFLGLANFAARIIGFVYFVFLGRVLGVEKFGQYNFALALVYNFYPVADFGIERLVLRDISRDKQKANYYFQKLFPLRVSLSLVSIVLINLIGFVLAKSPADRLNLLIFSLCLLPWTFNQLVAGIGNAFEKMEVQGLIIILMSLMTAFLGGLVAFKGGGVTQVLLAAFIGNLFVSLIAFYCARKIGLSLRIDFDFSFWRQIISDSWVFATIMISAVFYLRASVLLINFFEGNYATGIYSSIFKFIEASILFPQSFALALFPETARLLYSDKKKLKSDYLRSLGAILIFAIVFWSIFVVFSSKIVNLSYGPDYLASTGIIKILALAAIFFFLNSLPGNIIQNSNKIKYFLPFTVLNLVLVVLLGLILIPLYSIKGAAIAVLLAEIVGFFINNGFVWVILNEE